MVYLFLFYVHWCFACIYFFVKVSNLLKLELQTVMSYHCSELNLVPLEEQLVPLTAELSLQPWSFLIFIHKWKKYKWNHQKWGAKGSDEATSSEIRIHLIKLLVKWPHGNFQTMQAIAKGIGCSPQNDGKVLQLKTILPTSLNLEKSSWSLTRAFIPTNESL